MKNTQKGFIVPLLIIIAVLVVGGGVYFYSQKKSDISQTNGVKDNTQPVSNTETSSNTDSQQTEAEYQKLAAEKKAQADKIRSALFPLANLKTYTNSSFGFSFQYPQSLTLHVKTFNPPMSQIGCSVQGYIDENPNSQEFAPPLKTLFNFCVYSKDQVSYGQWGVVAAGYPKTVYTLSNKDLFFKPVTINSAKAVEINKVDYSLMGYTSFIQLMSGGEIEIAVMKPYSQDLVKIFKETFSTGL